MLRIARICVWCIYNQLFSFKIRELRSDKNKFTFALGKLTMDLMGFGEYKCRLIRILIAFMSSLFDDYNFCNVKFSPGLLLTLSVPS